MTAHAGPVAGLGALPDRWQADPFLVGEHAVGTVLAHRASADALLTVVAPPGRDRGLLGLGPAPAVAGLLRDAAVDRDPVLDGGGYATLTRGALEAALAGGGTAAEALRGRWSTEPSEWDWMWTDHVPAIAGTSGVERIPPADPRRDEVAALLARAHPTASTTPDDPRLLGWWAVREEGRLVAVVGAMALAPGLPPQLVSLGVDPAVRGRGLGALVLAAAVADGLASGASMVTLGLYADNDAARRLYHRLGFTLLHEFASRRRL